MASRNSATILLLLSVWISSVVSQTSTDCSFDVDLATESVSTCSLIFNVTAFAAAKWRTGTGAGANFVGGPATDASTDGSGGYVLTTTSDMFSMDTYHKKSWLLTGVATNSTGGAGRCMSFSYASDGLNLKSFKVFLITYQKDQEDIFVNDTFVANPSETKTTELWVQKETTGSKWKNAKVSFSAAGAYSLAFVGEPKNHYRSNIGYVAVDDIRFTEGPCGNECMFDYDTCTWSNADSNGDDDFDWSLGRSSSKRGTGPSRDQASALDSTITTGGFAYIDSSYPRRKDDKARLVSPVITTDEPLCIKFWLNMHGGGLGDIRLLFKSETNSNATSVVVWSLPRDNGTTNTGTDSWYPCQQTVFSRDPFTLTFEATVGFPGAGDIGLDTIRFVEGSCPSIPTGSNRGWGDCNFLYSNCGWEIPNPGSIGTCSMVGKVTENSFNPPGHTWSEFEIYDSYIRFDLNCYINQPRDTASLKSKVFSSSTPQCLSFWVYIFTTVATHTKFGALSVVLTSNTGKNTTLWTLLNEQQSGWNYAQVPIPAGASMSISFVGTKGTDVSGMIAVDDIAVFDSDCEVKPPQARYEIGDCTFDSGPCQYTVRNPTENTDQATLNWRFADRNTIKVLQDHTFEADEGGFMFIDTFNTHLTSHLRSPDLEKNTTYCFSFYFAPIYKDHSAKLSVYKDTSGSGVLMWQITQGDLSPSASQDVQWHYGQVLLTDDGPTPFYQVYVEGEVQTGGWAIDDIKLYRDTTDCEIRPSTATSRSP